MTDRSQKESASPDAQQSGPNLRDRLRSATSPHYELPSFDPDAVPAHPLDLVREWVTSALDAEVSQPTAMTLSTSSLSGDVSARTLLLKDVTDDGLWFASLSRSPKGGQLDENPRASLTLYWREQGRQIRVSGSVSVGPREVSERDFLARHPTARARAIAGEQSAPMPDAETVGGLMASARELLQADPDLVPLSWNAYVVSPEAVEFWQAADGHEEIRVGYRRRESNAWVADRLWP